MQGLFSRKSLGTLGLGAILSMILSIPAQAASPPPPPGGAATSAATSIDTSMCADPEVTQPFLAAKDNHFYALMPGEVENGFDGEGWELRNGASIVTATLPDGSTSQVLDLPTGAEAVSPTICVNHDYPIARTMVRNAEGGGSVNTYISYEGTKTWEAPKSTNKFQGNGHNEWMLSPPINLQPEKSTGWQRLRLLFVGGGKGSDFQVYNFYVDPRMTH